MEAWCEKVADEHRLNIDWEGVCQSGEVPYNVFNVPDEDKAVKALREHLGGADALTAPMWNGMALKDIGINKRLDETSFEVVAYYEYDKLADSEDDDDDPEITVNIGKTRVIRKETLKRLAVSPGAPQNVIDGKGINLNMQGEPEGVEVSVGYTTRSEVFYIKQKKLTVAYENTLEELVDKVNETAFRGRPKGEIRFDGAAYSYKKGQKEKVKVTFNFTISRNVQNYKIGNWLMTKLGWEYGWVKYKEPDEKKKKFNEPHYAVIDQVLEYADFGRLKIGR